MRRFERQESNVAVVTDNRQWILYAVDIQLCALLTVWNPYYVAAFHLTSCSLAQQRSLKVSGNKMYKSTTFLNISPAIPSLLLYFIRHENDNLYDKMKPEHPPNTTRTNKIINIDFSVLFNSDNEAYSVHPYKKYCL